MSVINLSRVRGDTKPFKFLITSDDQPKDITDSTFLMTADTEKGPDDEVNNVFQLAGVVTDGPGGAFEFRPTAEQMDLVGTYYYDVEETDTDGYVDTVVLPSRLKFIQDITKD